MANWQKEFEFKVVVPKLLKNDIEKLGIESDEGMVELILTLLQKHVDSKDKHKRLENMLRGN